MSLLLLLGLILAAWSAWSYSCVYVRLILSLMRCAWVEEVSVVVRRGDSWLLYLHRLHLIFHKLRLHAAPLFESVRINILQRSLVHRLLVLQACEVDKIRSLRVPTIVTRVWACSLTRKTLVFALVTSIWNVELTVLLERRCRPASNCRFIKSWTVLEWQIEPFLQTWIALSHLLKVDAHFLCHVIVLLLITQLACLIVSLGDELSLEQGFFPIRRIIYVWVIHLITGWWSLFAYKPILSPLTASFLHSFNELALYFSHIDSVLRVVVTQELVILVSVDISVAYGAHWLTITTIVLNEHFSALKVVLVSFILDAVVESELWIIQWTHSMVLEVNVLLAAENCCILLILTASTRTFASLHSTFPRFVCLLRIVQLQLWDLSSFNHLLKWIDVSTTTVASSCLGKLRPCCLIELK